MTTGTFQEHGDDGVFAAEFVLGLLDATQHGVAARRVAVDPGFAGLVASWEAHFASWLLDVPPAVVPGHLWPRVRRGLGWDAGVDVPGGLWRSTAFWRGATALAAAAALAALYLGRSPAPVQPAPPRVVVQAPPPMAPRPVTVLAREDGTTAWIASVSPGRDELLMVPVPSAPDAAGRVEELWIIPSGGAPVSLGAVSNAQAHTVAIPPTLKRAFVAGATLAVSLEPQAGMPHAAPSGPIVATGALQAP